MKALSWILCGVTVVVGGCSRPDPVTEPVRQKLADGGIIIDTGPAWFPLGPFNVRGDFGIGRATTMAVNPQNRYNVWLGTAGGGLWVRENKHVGDVTTAQAYNPAVFTAPTGRWFPHNGTMESQAIGAVVLDESSCDVNGCLTAYVGTGENSLRRDTYYGNGVYRVQWSQGPEFSHWVWERLDTTEQFKYGAVQKLALTGGNLYVALSTGNTTTSTHASVRAPMPAAGFGLHKLTGTTWSRVFETTTTDPNSAWPDLLLPTDLEQDPNAPGALYLGVMNEGVFYSPDGGATWQALDSGSRLAQASANHQIATTITDASAGTTLPPAGSFDHVEIAVDPTSKAVFAMFGNCPASLGGPYQRAIGACQDDSATAGKVVKRQPLIFRKGTTGNAWTAVTSPGSSAPADNLDDDVHYSRYTHLLTVHPNSRSIIYHGGVDLRRLTEAGTSWTQDSLTTLDNKTAAHLDFHEFMVFPAWDGGQDVYYTANDGGFYYLTKRDNVWRPLIDGLQITELYGIGIDYTDEDPNDSIKRTTAIAAGLQDNGCLAYNGTSTWVEIGSCGDGAEMLIQTPTTYYASSQHNDITRRPGVQVSTSCGPGCTETSLHASAAGARPTMPPRDKDIAFAVPYVQDDASKRLYIGTEVVSVVDGSDTAWKDGIAAEPAAVTISPVFDTVVNSTNNAIESNRNVVTALAIGANSPWTIYAGLYDGKLWRVSKGAQPVPGDWALAPAANLPAKTISSLAVHPMKPNEVWATISDFVPQTVWFSSNSGDSFAPQSTGLPANEPAKVLKIDPGEPAKLWLGTDAGAYRSTDYGVTWGARQANLPLGPIMDIEIDTLLDHVMAATHGRGVWMLTDSKPVLTVFEGWMDDGIWDVPINGVGFSCGQDGGCACTVHLIQDNGHECATGSLDATGSRIFVAKGDDKLRTDNFGSCTRCDGKPVIWGCFNGNCVYNPGGTPTPLSNCNTNGRIATVKVQCLGNDDATDSVGAKCPEQADPPSDLLDVDPVLAGTAPQAQVQTQAAATAVQRFFSVSATDLASPANGGDQVLCSANVSFSSTATKADAQNAIRNAINKSPACKTAGISAEFIAANGHRHDEDLAGGADYRLMLNAPTRTASQLMLGFGASPGLADNICYNMSDMGVYLENQLAIGQLRFLTSKTGAAGGDLVITERTPVGICQMTIPTTPGQSGSDIALAVFNAFNAPTTPNPVSCPEQSNPRDMTRETDSVITLLPTSMTVCVSDPGVGVTYGPHGLSIPVPKASWPMFGKDPGHRHRSELDGPTTNNRSWSFDAGFGVFSSPAVALDGTIYVGTDSHKLFALTPSGTEKWHYTSTGDINSSPAIGSDGTVYFGANDLKVHALRPTDGTQLWAQNVQSLIFDSSPVIGPDGTVYVGSDDNRVYALDPATGAVRWTFQTLGDVDSVPAVGGDGTVYVGSDDNKVYAIKPTGTLRWSFQTLGNVKSSPALSADETTVYIGSNDHKLYALNATTGAKRWSTDLLGSVRSSPAVGTDGTVYVGSDGFKVFALNPTTGAIIWSRATLGFVASSPALGANGLLYVGSLDSHVYALNTQTGAVAWSFSTPLPVRSSPAIGPGGVLYVGSDDGRLHAFKDSP